MKTEIIPAYDRQSDVKELFAEYTGMMLKKDPSIEKYLVLQRYDDELEHLQVKYGMPEGRLYLGLSDGKPAGCIALRKLDEDRCEMKRLYVRPEFRGQGLALDLVRRIIDDARNIGYTHLFLDTFPCLQDAIRLYKRFGFYNIAPYNDNPISESVFMRLNL